ncbi:MAG: hypothetical protein ACK41Q_06630 [Candidatus Brocadia sp.]
MGYWRQSGSIIRIRFRKDISGLDDHLEKGEFRIVLDWLRTHLHTHGRKFTLNELANKITGESLQTRSFISYLKNKFGEIYSLIV